MSSLEFREDGALVRQWHQNPDGSEWTSNYKYNDEGQRTALRTENSAGHLALQLYNYDAAGRLVQVIARPHDGVDQIVESYEFDPVGRKKKTLYIDVASQRPNTHFGCGVEGTDSIYSAQGTATVTTLYNESGKPTELIFCNGTDQPLSRIEFSYDHDGNLIEEAQTNVAEMLPPEVLKSLSTAQLETMHALMGAPGKPIRRVHRYDEQGRRIETRGGMGPLGWDKKTVTYNHHGDQIEEISEHEHRTYGIDGDGQLTDDTAGKSVSRSEARFRYEYDEYGNWLMKTIESRSDVEQEFTVCSIERRTIDYFDSYRS